MKYLINYMHPMSGEIEQVTFIADEGSEEKDFSLACEMGEALAQSDKYEVEST